MASPFSSIPRSEVPSKHIPKDPNNITLCHYTNEIGAIGIIQNAYIRQSEDTFKKGDDARYGPGTYFTSILPDRPWREIARNNFDGSRMFWQGQKVKVAFVFEYPRSEVIRCPAGRRDIWKVNGDVRLPTEFSMYFLNKEDSEELSVGDVNIKYL